MMTLGLENPYDPICGKCKLNENSQNPKQTYYGKGKKKVLIIIEKPSDADDFKGIPLSGESGAEFKLLLKMNDLSLENDFVVIHAVGCKIKKGKDPSKKQIDCCSPRIKEIIDKLKPKHIWLLGDVAIDCYLRTFYPKRFKTTTSELWSDRQIPCRINNAWLHPMYAIDFSAKNKNEFAKITFKKQLEKMINQIGEPKPVNYDWYKDVSVCFYKDEVIEHLETILHNAKYVTFDYETTGLKPYEKRHKILTISCSGLDRFYQPVTDSTAFPFQYKNHFNKKEKNEIYKLWKAILTSDKIGKIAHHMKFENLWTKQILKFDIKKWHFCTMLGSYLYDERKGGSGLKFVSFCRWGTPNYDASVEKFIKADTSNGFNQLEKVNISDLCLYNAIDDKLTSQLFIDLKLKLKKDEELKKAYLFLHKGSLTLSEIEMNGLPVNTEHFDTTKTEVQKKITELKKELNDSEEAKKFFEQEGKTLDYGSPKDLRTLFFDVLGLESVKKTATGFDCVDHDALTSIKHKFANKLLELRKYDKINSTYMDQLIREINSDERIHPFFHLHTTRTNRSSSNAPNSQNLPSRDEEGKLFVKKGFKVPDDCYFAEVDFGSQEVRIAACFTKDPVLVSYINDPSTDMHKDECKNLYLLDDSLYEKPEYTKTLKRLRFFTKNGFIFPQFYGSYWRSCARSLWNDIEGLEFEKGYSVYDYLAEKGISCLTNITSFKDKPKKGCFEYHIMQCENQFWKKYSTFRKWQETSKEFYINNGYVYSMFGTRRRGYLNQNKILNTGIQGTGFQCLLWSLTELNNYLKKNKFKSKIIGQIHDSILIQLQKDEAISILKQCQFIMEEKISQYYKWLIVPLAAEIECSELGGTWYDKKEIDIIKTFEKGVITWLS